MRKNILVTGGAGFVGSHLCKRIMNDGHNVVTVDDLSNGKVENVPDGVEFIHVDIAQDKFFSLLKDYAFDSVIHCAAQTSNALSFKDPINDMSANLKATHNILEYCVQNNIKRYIFTSSMSAYGQPPVIPTKEDTVCSPDSFYAVHKLASEQYAKIYAQVHGIKFTIFRLYTTYGYGQNLENRDQGLISIYLSYIVKKDELIVKGSKDRTRDIIHVDDVVNAISLALDNSQACGKTYNLGTGINIKIENLIEMLTEGLGYKKGEYPITYTIPTLGDPFDTHADITAAMKDLNWKPTISPEEGIRVTLETYKKSIAEEGAV
ncbi:NAD-dependent epimerase/dehydratase family protein [Fibrobacterota bacterium]